MRPKPQTHHPHLHHLLWHDLGPLLGDGDLRVGVDEDFDDLWHGRTGLEHLVVGKEAGFVWMRHLLLIYIFGLCVRSRDNIFFIVGCKINETQTH